MILGIETSGAIASVAVGDHQSIRSEMIVHAGLTHSEQLVPQIETVLQMGRVAKRDITGIAVTIGPGSFTGLRIGLGTAKALAYAWGVPVVGVLSTDVLAAQFLYSSAKVYTVIDAQKKQVYGAVYENQINRMVQVKPIQVQQVKSLIDQLSDMPKEESVILVGDGIKRLETDYQEAVSLGRIDPRRIQLGAEIVQRPRASYVIALSIPKFESHEIEPIERIEPYYIRKSEAEVQWDEKNKDVLASGTYVEPTVTVREAVGER